LEIPSDWGVHYVMGKAYVIGVGMHPFGRFLDKGLKQLTRHAVWEAIEDAGIDPKKIETAYFSNSFAGALNGQHSVRGQIYLRDAGFSEIPIINIENACAGGATAFQQACLAVTSGQVDIALAVGAEKMFVGDNAKTIAALGSAGDVEVTEGQGLQFTALYAFKALDYMEKYGATPFHFAKVAEKNSHNASMNPLAQFRKRLSVEEVLNARMIADPLTLYMCSPIADGSAAVIVASEKVANQLGQRAKIHVKGSILKSGQLLEPNIKQPSVITKAAKELYEKIGIGASDIDMLEVHDAAVSVEFEHVEDLGLIPEGTAFREVEKGTFAISGKLPMNMSGGLTSKGHPVGASGVAQIVEITKQLRGEVKDRQVNTNGGLPKIGLCLNTGGRVEDDRAAIAITILGR
jgi:acetyl-CoA acyltransferase